MSDERERRGGPDRRGPGRRGDAPRGQRPSRGESPPRGRGSRARLSRDEIVQAALEIAAEEGVRNVSMRKVARRLGAGTMSLYHYVRTKDDLLALMDDAVMGELVIPEGEMPEGWRARLTLIANLSFAAWMRRPWLLDDRTFRITENGLRHADQSMGALEGLDIPPALKSEIVAQIDDYILGFAVSERRMGGEKDLADDSLEAAIEYTETKLATGDYPHLAAAAGAGKSVRERWMEMMDEVYDEGRFERGLNRLLDGIEAELVRLGALPG